MSDWTDKEFLSYVEIHSETELALFHRDHVNRLLRLAGHPEIKIARAFLSVDRYEARPLVKLARERLVAVASEPES